MLFLPASSFVMGSTSHWGALACGLLVLVVAVFSQRKCPHSRLARWSLWLIVLANLSSVFHTSASHYFSGKTQDLNHILPLHLCDLSSLVAAAALLTRRPLLCELTYYLGLGGTLQGLITPNLFYDFPHPTFLAFFQLHLFVVIAALFLPLGLGWRPRTPLLRTLSRIFLIICGYLVVVFGINSLLGTNYAFVMGKPENPSLYDHLGPHPWYLLSVLGLVLVMLALLSLPFLREKTVDQFQKH